MQMAKAFIDARTNYGLMVPVEGSHTVSSAETVRAVEEHWITWAGPPKRLHYDLTKAQQSEEFE
jgi:transposase InsO family protein